MNIGVIGGGSIGLLVSGYLSQEHDVTLYVRRDQQKQILNDRGLLLSDSTIPCYVKALLTDELKKEDYLIVCVKQTQIPDIISTIQKQHVHTPLIFLQNGMGHIEEIRNFYQPVVVGVVEHGALRKSDHKVTHTGKGIIKLSILHGEMTELECIVKQLNQANFPFQIAENWKHMLSEKLVINAVINPLTTLFDVTNGAVFNNPHIAKLAKELCWEACTTLGLEFLVQWKNVQAVAENTKDNVSSMLKDNKGHRKTEIDAISGYLIKQSKNEIPYTTFVYNSIRALEVKKGNNE